MSAERKGRVSLRCPQTFSFRGLPRLGWPDISQFCADYFLIEKAKSKTPKLARFARSCAVWGKIWCKKQKLNYNLPHSARVSSSSQQQTTIISDSKRLLLHFSKFQRACCHLDNHNSNNNFTTTTGKSYNNSEDSCHDRHSGQERVSAMYVLVPVLSSYAYVYGFIVMSVP